MSGLLSRWNQRRENVAKEAEQQEAEQHDVSLTRQTETDDSAATKGQAADVNSNVQQGEQAAPDTVLQADDFGLVDGFLHAGVERLKAGGCEGLRGCDDVGGGRPLRATG